MLLAQQFVVIFHITRANTNFREIMNLILKLETQETISRIRNRTAPNIKHANIKIIYENDVGYH